MDTSKLRKRMPVSTLVDPKIVLPAIGQAFAKLNPATLIKNPVIFVLEVVTVLTTVLFVRDLVAAPRGRSASPSRSFCGCGSPCCSRISPKRWRRGAGKAQADTLRKTRTADARQAHSDAGQLRGLSRASRPKTCKPATLSYARPATSSPATAT